MIVFFVFTFVDALVVNTFEEKTTLFKVIIEFGKSLSPGVGSIVVGVGVVGAGVPVGFVLYQIYFFWRWIWGIPSAEKERIKDIRKTLEGIPDKSKLSWSREYLVSSKAFNEHLTDVIDKMYKEAWYCLEIILADFAAEDKKAKIMYERSLHLFDLFHALGTNMWAVIFGFVLYLLAKMYYLINSVPFQLDRIDIFAIIVTLFLGWLLFMVFYSNWNNVRYHIISLHNYLLRKLINERLHQFNKRPPYHVIFFRPV